MLTKQLTQSTVLSLILWEEKKNAISVKKNVHYDIYHLK